LLHADRRTDVTKFIVAFRSFANAPKKLKRDSRNVKRQEVEKEGRLERRKGGKDCLTAEEGTG